MLIDQTFKYKYVYKSYCIKAFVMIIHMQRYFREKVRAFTAESV